MPANRPAVIRLLNLLEAIRGLSPFDAMTADEESLLRSLIVRWHSGAPITVSSAMGGISGVSAATAYRRLAGLRDKGLIDLRVDAADRRVKWVEPTPLAHAYRDQVSRALEGASAASGVPAAA